MVESLVNPQESIGSIPHPSLQLCHVELKDANEFILNHHRHHKRIQGHRFSIGALLDNKLVGVAVIGRPIAGGKHQRDWVEVTRCCSDGTKNVCSFLYAASARAASCLGYFRIQTYIMKEELGITLKAAGWKFDRMSAPVMWFTRPNREVEPHLMDRKQLWYKDLIQKGK